MAATNANGEGIPKVSGRTTILLALLLGTLLAALDSTVVGTSLPKVVADIGGFEHFAWVFSSYMLASTIVTTQPLEASAATGISR
jgi:MFS family permease